MGKLRTRLLRLDSYVSIDIETTGLSIDYCEIIELAAARVEGGVVIERFQELVKPEGFPIPEFIEDLTGITSDMLADARSLAEVLPDYLAFVGDSPVVGQRVTFDIKFIDAFAQRLGLGAFQPLACDTMRISRLVFPDEKHHRLKDNVRLCKEVAADAPAFGNAHRAMADAEMTLWCYEVMWPLLEEKFGEDPEKALAREKASRRTSSDKNQYREEKEYIDNLVPTVDEIDEDNPFFGTIVCFTGKLSSMPRKAAWQGAVNLGAEPVKNMKKTVDYLVVGSFDFSSNMKGEKSSKLKAAEKMLAENGSPEIVSEDFFTQFLA